MNDLSRTTASRAVLALAGALALAACGTGGGAAWTYAPLGPTPTAGEATGAPASPGGSPDASPGGSPGNGVALETVTPPDQPFAFVPDVLEAPAATEVTVTYLNDSDQPHNIVFFEGQDSTAPVIAETPIVTGPGAPETVTFTTPEEPGDYYVWCQVHTTTMEATLTVTE